MQLRLINTLPKMIWPFSSRKAKSTSLKFTRSSKNILNPDKTPIHSKNKTSLINPTRLRAMNHASQSTKNRCPTKLHVLWIMFRHNYLTKSSSNAKMAPSPETKSLHSKRSKWVKRQAHLTDLTCLKSSGSTQVRQRYISKVTRPPTN